MVEGECLEGKEKEAIDEEQDEGVAEIAHEAEVAKCGAVIVRIFITQVKRQHVGLKEGYEGHGGSGKAWGVAEDIDSETEQERHEHVGTARHIARHE